MRVLCVSSSRSDVGIWRSIWAALAASGGVSLHVALTGAHSDREEERGSALSAIPASARVHAVDGSISGATPAEVAKGMALIHGNMARLLEEVVPDIVLVVGDRLDLLPAVSATLPFNLPIGHVHGGELSYGAVDDRIRHSISKLAHLHFVSGADAALRLSRMGEQPDRIFVVGAPGLDHLAATAPIEREAFLGAVGGLEDGSIRLVTVHPETNSERPLMPMEAILDALDALPGPTLLTASNEDLGGATINARLRDFASTRRWVRFVPTLGPGLYPNALRHAAVMIGNSSSGLIEAGYFGLPVVNVGSRQDGRLRGANVRDVPSRAHDIAAAASACLGMRFDPAVVSMYGDGRAAPRLVERLLAVTNLADLRSKEFNVRDVQFAAPWYPAHARERANMVGAGP